MLATLQIVTALLVAIAMALSLAHALEAWRALLRQRRWKRRRRRSASPPTNPQRRSIMNTSLRIFALAATTAALVFSSGCSTPETRIRQNPALFAQLAPEQQEMIRRGQVAVGFNAEMVRLALGEPDRFTTRTDQDGVNEIWHYVTYDGPTGIPLYRGWYHHYYMWGDPLYPYYLTVPDRRERDRFSVVFRNGRVTALERERQS
jgi:hypothetical protein